MADERSGFHRGTGSDEAHRGGTPTTWRARMPLAIAAILVVVVVGLLAALAWVAAR